MRLAVLCLLAGCDLAVGIHELPAPVCANDTRPIALTQVSWTALQDLSTSVDVPLNAPGIACDLDVVFVGWGHAFGGIHREPDRLQQIELKPVLIRRRAVLDVEIGQDGVEIDRVEAQKMHKLGNIALAIIGQQMRRKRAERGVRCLLTAPGSTRRPESRIEHLRICGHSVEARNGLGVRHHREHRLQAVRRAGKLAEVIDLAADSNAQCNYSFKCPSCCILVNGVRAVQSAPLQEHSAKRSARTFWSYEKYIDILRRYDACLFIKSYAKTMREIQSLSGSKMFFHRLP